MARFSKAALALFLLPQGILSWNTAWNNKPLQSRRNHRYSKNSSPKPFASALSMALSEDWEALSQKLSSTTTPPPAVAAADLSDSALNTATTSVSEATSVMTNALANFVKLIENTLPTDAQETLVSFPSTLSDAYTQTTTTLQENPLTDADSVINFVQTNLIPVLNNIPAPVGILLSAGFTYTLLTSLLTLNADPPPSSPYPLKKYDAASARAYFDSKLNQVVGRALEVGFLSARFGLDLALDYVNKNLEKNADKRAQELTKLLTVLGPSFIKIGQSLSIRTDLISPAYVRGLKSLQDQVPSFPSDEAYAIIKEDLGVDVNEVFESLGETPVAAASLGQVYKGVLRETGQEVAVKVQRPDIMNQIALDMYLIREVAAVLKRTFNLNTDLVGTTDAWGVGFVDELNYLDEGENAMKFTESMQATPLANVVFSPPVIEKYCSERVLVTEWVDGERLDRSDQKDVTVLCSIAMNTYLTMMLETGLLHCDPHPGNLLRTPDGRLCILDWGMVTRLDSNLQITLIEHMAHLTGADYAEVPRDLLELGFIPPEKADLIEDSGVVETLADIYGAWTKGGGAAAINVNKVVAQLQDLTAENGNLFQIPAYFAYIAKSFSVLEGIGLSNDPKYSIINECLPYVSKRLLTDKNERTGGALGTFIFGPDKNDIEKRIVDYDRIEQLVTGFGDYSTSASGALLGKEGVSRMEMMEQTADQILDLVVTEEETPLQAILIEQLAKIISATSRSVWSDIRERSGKLPSGRSVLGTLVDPLGLWRTSPIVRMNELDIKTVDTTRDLMTLIQHQSSTNTLFDVDSMTNEEVIELSQVLVKKVWERRRGVAFTGGRLANMLVKMTADKLEKGERDLMILPDSETVNTDSVKPTPVTESRSIQRSQEIDSKPSPRLANAKRLLAQLENETK